MRNTWVLRLRRNLLFLSLLSVTLYLPLAYMVYSSSWYSFNCRFHDRCEILGMTKVEESAQTLTGYFRHANELIGNWTPKDKRHLAEVRGIYDRLAWLFLIAIVSLLVSWRFNVVARYAKWNLFLIGSLLLLVPLFTPLWKEFFHSLVFDNLAWKNMRADISWYLMPRLFFRNSFVFLILASMMINVLLFISTRRVHQASGNISS